VNIPPASDRMVQPNRYGLNRTFGAAIGTIALVVLIAGTTVFLATGQVRNANAARDRSRDILAQLDGFLIGMLNQETGVRGYLITGRRTSLEPYQEGRPAFEQAIAGLRGAIGSSEEQRRLLDQAESSAREWQKNIGEVISAAPEDGDRSSAFELEHSGAGKQYFDAFRANLSAIRVRERQSFDQQTALVLRAERVATIALILGTLLTLAICLGVGLTISRFIARPLLQLVGVIRRLAMNDTHVMVPSVGQRNEVGEIARAIEVFRTSLIELDRTALLRATTDVLPAMLGYINADRRIGFLNSEFARWFALGVADVSEAPGRLMKDVFPDENLPGVSKELVAAFAGEQQRFERVLVRPDGSEADFDIIYRPHGGAKDGMAAGVVLLCDVTERKDIDRRLVLQAQELRRQNEELEQFAYVASHDLKAPMRGIDNLVTWIEEDLTAVLTEDTRANMELLKSRVKRLESLLDDLLAYSRAGREDLVAERVDTGALVAELATLLSPPDGFEIKGAPELPVLHTPRAALTQALQNLISNAIKHHDNPASGHVWIEARQEGAMTEFVVADDGPGIPEQFRSRVFGMFQTLRPRDEIEGSGMGLAIVKKLVERQIGPIWLTEGLAGRGLAVHFTWPSTKKV
jgi:signal transduction histidine kinase/CHASE3 domain sensor protein